MNFSQDAEKALQYLTAYQPEFDVRTRCSTEMCRKGAAKLKFIFPDGAELKNASVRYRLKRHEFCFGANGFMYQQFVKEDAWKNEVFAEKFKELFNLMVIPFYWDTLEPKRGHYRFGKDSERIYRRPPVDALLEFCESGGITPKGHPLAWHTMLPEWLPSDHSAWIDEHERRISTIAERYGKRIPKWDVYNEGLQLDPLGAEGDVPDNHILTVFKLAEKYFPQSTELIYNEGPWVSWNNYRGTQTPLYLLGRRLKSQGAALRGLGMQYHLFPWDMKLFLEWTIQMCDPAHLYAHMDLYGKLGVPLNVSEITIPAMKEFGDGSAFQEFLIEKLYRIWFSHPAVNSITYWNIVDQTAAGSIVDGGENRFRGGLLNYDMSERPAFKVLRRLIKEEWTSAGTLEFDRDHLNKLYGFYGDYDLEIRTDKGIFNKTVRLSAHAGKEIRIIL